MGKFYAVRKGLKTGVFNDWQSCQEAIKGYSKAEFKSFKTENEAIQYLMGEEVIKEKTVKCELEDDKSCNVYIGVFTKQGLEYGGVSIIIETMTELKKYLVNIYDTDIIKLKNIYLEVSGAYLGIKAALALGFKKINVYNSYNGVKEWADGTWQARQLLMISFYNYCRQIRTDQRDVRLCFYGAVTDDKLISAELKRLSAKGLISARRLIYDNIVSDEFDINMLYEDY